MFYPFTSEELQKVSNESGLYFFYNKNKELVYIGKAKNLFYRIGKHITDHFYASYFMHRLKEFTKKGLETLSNEEHQKFRQLLFAFEGYTLVDVNLDQVQYFTCQLMPHIETKESEKALIKKHKPCYNISFNDSPMKDNRYKLINYNYDPKKEWQYLADVFKRG